MQRIASSFAVSLIVLASSLSGCNKGSPTSRNAMQAAPTAEGSGQIPPAPANDPDAQASALMAAAEPFENLTENAFIPDIKKLDDFIAKAKSSADGAAKLLAPGEAKVLSNHVSAIDAARAGNNRADLAIAAVEGYRTLVTNSGGHRKVPKEVSLLDYSGFRYQADLKATPVRWSDTAIAVDFADTQWQQISATVKDLTLVKNVSETLAAMRSASQSKDAKAAMAASTRELDLVDGLEKSFAHN
jgi:hypothetical protein